MERAADQVMQRYAEIKDDTDTDGVTLRVAAYTIAVGRVTNATNQRGIWP
jgi:glutamate dehydrogenase/leucine dehydrogenase